MKKALLILATPLFLFSCNDSDDNQHDDVVTVETDNQAMVVDYSTMTFSDQEADMNERIAMYRTAESKVPEENRVQYTAEVDNLENDIIIFRTKRAEYDKDPENEELKAEMQTLGDRIRNSANNINNEFQSIGATLEDHHNQKVDDVTDAADDVADGAKNVGETLKDHHDQKVKDVKGAAKEVKEALKTE